MPAVYAFLTYLLSAIAVPLVKKILVALGVGYVSYSGVSALLDSAYLSIQGMFAGLPLAFVQAFGYLEIDKMISVLFAAFAANMSVKLLSGFKVG